MKRNDVCRRCNGELVDRIAPKSGRKLRYCPACHSKAKRLARSAKPEYVLAQRQAHKAVSRAIRLGHITRKPCEAEGCADPRTEAHHPDYSRPLQVKWFCRTHHRRLHVALRKLEQK